ncbi:MerR family transcriptional regulator [Nocardia anaemiae]|uniref:MerR family transcriptional regulator n=1 Tax=Nocardia anaemiae TaxID=263910 RepID=UPI0007A3CE60|nr:MerR family transcriptional regulator [Nocardia anaemiae]
MTIGQLAESTGVPASAIRYWERHGLLPEPERRGGQRRYPAEAADRIVLLRKCQTAGLSLDEIREFQQDRPQRKTMLTAKLVEIERRIVELQHAHELLAHAVQCSKLDIVTCPTFRAQIATWQSPQHDST